MSTRADVLAAVRAAESPIDVATIAARAGVPSTTARFHLNALEGDGVIERVEPTTRTTGRPRLSYRARPTMDPDGPRGYQSLAAAFLSDLDDPAAAEQVGYRWGRSMAPRPATTPLGEVAQILTDMDFAPEVVDGSRIELTHCPFLELAVDPPRRICALHLGLIRGVLAERAADVSVAALEPFAAPGVCIARFETSS